jgi:hypothetical protein
VAPPGRFARAFTLNNIDLSDAAQTLGLMSRSSPPPEDLRPPHRLRWLVERRSEVQGLLLELHTFLQMHRGTLDKNELDRAAAELLVGAAFSLWRAVVLFDAHRDIQIVLDDAEDFLDKLLRDNMVDYEREHRMKPWTVGYYLNNARFRLDAVVNKIGPDLDMFREFRALHEAGMTHAEARDSWQVLFDTLRSALLLLQDVERVRAQGAPSAEPAGQAGRAQRIA